MNLRHLTGLKLIGVVAWLLILGECYFSIAVIRLLGPPFHRRSFPSTALELILTAGLGVLWAGVNVRDGHAIHAV